MIDKPIQNSHLDRQNFFFLEYNMRTVILHESAFPIYLRQSSAANFARFLLTTVHPKKFSELQIVQRICT